MTTKKQGAAVPSGQGTGSGDESYAKAELAGIRHTQDAAIKWVGGIVSGVAVLGLFSTVSTQISTRRDVAIIVEKVSGMENTVATLAQEIREIRSEQIKRTGSVHEVPLLRDRIERLEDRLEQRSNGG